MTRDADSHGRSKIGLEDEIESRMQAATEYCQVHGLTLDLEASRDALRKHYASGERGRFVTVPMEDGTWSVYWVLPS